METRLVEGVAVREWGDDGEPGILLWPGLGFTGAYFTGVGPKLPGRCVAVDPPGFGGSPPLETSSYERLGADRRRLPRRRRPGRARLAVPPLQRAWEAFAAASPLIDLHVAEDWSHHPFLEVPDRSAALVAAWLRPYL